MLRFVMVLVVALLSVSGASAFDTDGFKGAVDRVNWVRCAPVIAICARDATDAKMNDEAKFLWGGFCYEAGALTRRIIKASYNLEGMKVAADREISRYVDGSRTFQENWIKACVRTLMAN